MASGTGFRAALAALLAGWVGLAGASPASMAELASTEVRRTAVLARQGDARGRPFAVVDKRHARLYVFHADGRLAGASAALLGLARGDVSPPGIGKKVLTGIPPGERITPAGRFDSEPGRNLQGEAIVWIDYEAAVAIHRLRPAPAAERRAQRLASDSADERRISLGCVVVDGGFYDRVVAPLLGRQRGVVYVLPERDAGTTLAGDSQQLGGPRPL